MFTMPFLRPSFSYFKKIGLPQIEMLPKLCPNTVCLSEPPTQAENSLVDIVLKFHRIVKGALSFEGILPDFGVTVDKFRAVITRKICFR
jgi:hypothetical protein